MLVLSRKVNEKIRIAEDITITVLVIQGGKVKIGIDAPDDVDIIRTELLLPPEKTPLVAAAIY